MIDEKKFNQLLHQLTRLADAAEVIALANAPKAPNFVRTIGEYPGFDWAGMGAQVVTSDEYGAATVRWGGYLWTRRAPDNKFGEAVWFSRPDGKDGDGKTRYVRLVTFKKPGEAEPMGRKAETAVRSAAESAGAIEAPAAAKQLPAPGQAPAAANGRPEKYDPTKDARLRALDKPAAALDLDGVQPSVTLYWQLVNLFRIDRAVAADVLREAGGDLAQGVRNLDRLAEEFK